jgi:hypothetical protein
MAKYEVLETSFINNKLVHAGEFVDINDDPKKGGMKPGSNVKAAKGGASKDDAAGAGEGQGGGEGANK